MTGFPPPPRRPAPSRDDIAGVLQRVWGIAVADVTELPGERERNYAVTGADGRRHVLKVGRRGDGADHALQTRLLDLLAAAGVTAPLPIPAPGDDGAAHVDSPAGPLVCRLLSWVDGRPLADVNPHTRELLREVGAAAGRVAVALREVGDGADGFLWDLRDGAATVGRLAGGIADPADRQVVESLAARCAERLDPLWAGLHVGTVHGDLNDHNVLVAPDGAVGVVDLGDAHRSVLVAEAAVAAAYAGLGKADPIEAFADVAAGFHAVRPLSDDEMAALAPLAVLRLTLSIAIAAHQTAADPANPYLGVSLPAATAAVRILAATGFPLAEARIRHACGVEPIPASPALTRWLDGHRSLLHGVLDVATTPGTVCAVDWSVASPHASHPEVAPSMAEQSAAVAATMAEQGAAVGVGRRGEPRIVYAAPEFAVATNRGPGWRTVHLGVDLSCPAGTGVRALLDGTVARVDDDAVDRGYGPVVTLHHRPGDGPGFWTLYGHLSRESVAGLSVGDRIAGGDRFASVGAPVENGGWTPHLHFQVIADHLGIDGPFPGVALADEWDVWAAACPSVAAALGLPEEVVDAPPPDPASVATAHRSALPPSQRTAYRTPLVAVRGHRTRLYDPWGRGHLDAVNNVAHVGHQHPHVVAAIRRQAGLTDTNTRYPHPERTRYLGRLAARFPDHLDTVFLVSSGSEANELALRLASTAAGRRDVIVLAGGYHGNTGTLVAASPAKHDGPGGSGPPSWVHRLPLPDVYRRADDADPARFHRQIAEVIGAAGEAPSAVLVEAVPGVAGQVTLPPGYLAHLFATVTTFGGVAIADEVQVGLGRVGSHWWAFEREGAVPDIVTLGKPLGNGYPLAAVVTTRRIAEAFDTGMEFFTSFGGNPVACAAGNAVLDVIDAEGLRERAAMVGRMLVERLTGLASHRPLIGDVRGPGLFIGVELVTDPHSKHPAPDQAAYVVERCRELGVLLAVDGVHRNVLKIKPPMVFDERDVDQLVDTLDTVLGEDGARPL